MARDKENKRPQQPNLQDTSKVETNQFFKGMTKDPDMTVLGKENWTHAINAINNSVKGDVGTIGNEQANLLCAEIPYEVIGGIHLFGDKWVIYSTDNTSSEIGIFDDSLCEYRTFINDECLSFDQRYLITGASKENFDCSWQIYWDDGKNPSRTLNIGPVGDDGFFSDVNVPWKKTATTDGDNCVIYENDIPLTLDCDLIRLAPYMNVPCINVKKSDSGGQLKNGSYQVFIAYTLNENKIGDYIAMSEIQPLFDHDDMSGSLEIFITDLDTNFEFFELVVLANNQMQNVAKRIGFYSTVTTEGNFRHITIDFIDPKLQTIDIETLPAQNPRYEKSDKMYALNDYLIRQGPYEQFDFNYQCQANEINTMWVSTRYPSTYYRDGGNKPTFMRDEQYAFFIRFVYRTGERSNSYHIPGREKDIYPNGTLVSSTFAGGDSGNNYVASFSLDPNEQENWQVLNTAVEVAGAPGIGEETDDGGIVVGKGYMGYWESTENYPSTDPVRWCELCGDKIRHHKMPDEQTCLVTRRSSDAGQFIYILGAEFSNITRPRYNDGTLIENIVGYEIMVGSRKGAKSIIAKGLLRNCQGYNPDVGEDAARGEGSDIIGVFPNYPFNDLNADPYILTQDSAELAVNEQDAYKRNASFPDLFSFHSPETSFNRPFLSPFEVKSYGPTTGGAAGRFKRSEDHPKHKLIRDIAAIIAAVLGAGYAIQEMRGPKVQKVEGGSALSIGKQQGPYEDRKGDPGMDYSGSVTQDPWTMNSVATTSFFASNATITATGPGNLNYDNLEVQTTDNHEEIPDDANGEPMDGTAPGPAGSVIADAAEENLEDLDTADADIGQEEAGDSLANPADVDNLVSAATTPINSTLDSFSSLLGLPYDSPFGDTPQEQTMILATTPIDPINTPAAAEEIYLRDINQRHEAAIKQNKTRGYTGPRRSIESKESKFKGLPGLLQLMFKIHTFLNLMTTGGQEIIELIYNLMGYQDYVFKYNGYGLYHNEQCVYSPTCTAQGGIYSGDIFRRRVDEAVYISNAFQNIGPSLRVNNLQRPKTVIIGSEGSLPWPTAYGGADTSRQIIGSVGTGGSFGHPTSGFWNPIVAHYVGLKLNFENQYGQLDGIMQLPTGCSVNFDPSFSEDDIELAASTGDIFKSPVVYGGDCYVNRYSEKVIMPFFWDFLKGEPDGVNFNYYLHQNIPNTRFWYNADKYNLSGLVQPFTDLTFSWLNDPTNPGLPSAMHNLDRGAADAAWSANSMAATTAGGGNGFNTGTPLNSAGSGTTTDLPDEIQKNGLFTIKGAFMYTHSSGINEFFVESELNVALRDWEDQRGKRHYDVQEYTDLTELFHADIIKDGNYYKYDHSLSKSNFVTDALSFAFIQDLTYDPLVAENCLTHYPKRVVYSLQAQKEAKKDFWRVFLPNNHRDFKNQPTVIKTISKTGALMLFPHLAPQQFQGVDTLQTMGDVKITIGDAGLFNQAFQNVVNTDLEHEYGSCENLRSVINTPSGLYYISQEQGKIFSYTGQLEAISDIGMKQWFNKYLPSKLLAAYPNAIGTVDADNPLAGVGCHSVYDPNYDIVYFSKRDFVPLDEWADCIEYNPELGFVINNTLCEDRAQVASCPPGYEIATDADGHEYCDCNDIVIVPFEQYELVDIDDTTTSYDSEAIGDDYSGVDDVVITEETEDWDDSTPPDIGDGDGDGENPIDSSALSYPTGLGGVDITIMADASNITDGDWSNANFGTHNRYGYSWTRYAQANFIREFYGWLGDNGFLNQSILRENGPRSAPILSENCGEVSCCNNGPTLYPLEFDGYETDPNQGRCNIRNTLSAQGSYVCQTDWNNYTYGYDGVEGAKNPSNKKQAWQVATTIWSGAGTGSNMQGGEPDVYGNEGYGAGTNMYGYFQNVESGPSNVWWQCLYWGSCGQSWDMYTQPTTSVLDSFWGGENGCNNEPGMLITENYGNNFWPCDPPPMNPDSFIESLQDDAGECTTSWINPNGNSAACAGCANWLDDGQISSQLTRMGNSDCWEQYSQGIKPMMYNGPAQEGGNLGHFWFSQGTASSTFSPIEWSLDGTWEAIQDAAEWRSEQGLGSLDESIEFYKLKYGWDMGGEIDSWDNIGDRKRYYTHNIPYITPYGCDSSWGIPEHAKTGRKLRTQRPWQAVLPLTPYNELEYDLDGNEIPFEVAPGGFPMWGGIQSFNQINIQMGYYQPGGQPVGMEGGLGASWTSQYADLAPIDDFRKSNCCYRKVGIALVAGNNGTGWDADNGDDLVMDLMTQCSNWNQGFSDMYVIFVGGMAGYGGMDWLETAKEINNNVSFDGETIYQRLSMFSGPRGQCSDTFAYPDNTNVDQECFQNMMDGCTGNINYFFALDITNARQIAMQIGKMIATSVDVDAYPDKDVAIPLNNPLTGEPASTWTHGTGTVAGVCEKSSCDEDIITATPAVEGCTDPLAVNYNPLATEPCTNFGFGGVIVETGEFADEGENACCIYDDTEIPGCTDPDANNYNPDATIDNGTCRYDTVVKYGCTDTAALNFDPSANAPCTDDLSGITSSEYEGDCVNDQTGDNCCCIYPEADRPGTPECPPGYDLINVVDDQYIECRCSLSLPVVLEDDLTPISLDDETYFKDISWTVSYDPKAKAWISFHDWHPDLMFPSLNHFLTTKKIDLENPICPPGYVWNEDNMLCEYFDSITELAENIHQSYPCCSTEESLPPIDIVFAIDSSGSATVDTYAVPIDINDNGVQNYNRELIDIQLGFINEFIELITPQMNAEQIQVGITSWSGTHPRGRLTSTGEYPYDPDAPGIAPGNGVTTQDGEVYYQWLNCTPGQIGELGDYSDPYFVPNAAGTHVFIEGMTGSMPSTDYDDYTLDPMTFAIGGIDLDGISQEAWEGSGLWRPSMTHIPFTLETYANGGTVYEFGSNTAIVGSGLTPASAQLLRPENSTLGDRTSQTGFRRILVILTDAKDNDSYVSGCSFWGPNAGGINAPTELYAIRVNPQGYCFDEMSDLDQDNIRNVACEMYQNEDDATADGELFRAFGFGLGVTRSDILFKSPDPFDAAFDPNYPAAGDCSQGCTNGYPDPWPISLQWDVYTGAWGFFSPYSALATFPINSSAYSCNDMLTTAEKFLQAITPIETRCECNCPTGWVEIGSTDPMNDEDGNPTNPLYPPHCVKSECRCKDVVGVDTTTADLTVTGDCDDAYLWGMSEIYGTTDDGTSFTYVNPNPQQCTWEWYDAVEGTLEAGSIWRHNVRCDVYSNYYNVQYPWEIEFVESTGQMVNTVRNVEYEMEAYKYKLPTDADGEPLFGYSLCDSRWHDLDFNFNRAYIYNTEQVSGYLHLNISPKNNAPALNDYPSIVIDINDNSNSYVDILYSKEEQKYRFNQFWDMTLNRGEVIEPIGNFDSNTQPIEQAIMWTDLNGYIRDLNSLNLDYDKPPHERKKFRHYWNKIVLRREPELDEDTGEVILETRKMLLKLDNTKVNLSIR